MRKPPGQFNLCLAHSVAPVSNPRSATEARDRRDRRQSRERQRRVSEGSERVSIRDPQSIDYLGGFAVSIHGADELSEAFKHEHDDYSAIITKALADRLAEAFSEYLHKQTRIAWGFGRDEELSYGDLIREKYRGIRPAAGYPACPDHTEKRILFDLLQAEKNAGITLTETFAMLPASSVSGLYFAHPEAKYFAVGKIGKDQVADYARRKQMGIQTIERWLSPNLNYDPAASS